MRLTYQNALRGLLFVLLLVITAAPAWSQCTVKAAFKGDTVICSGSIGYYKAAFTKGNFYRWRVLGGTILSGQGTDSISVSWNESGKSTVQLTDSVSSTCYNMLSKTITVGLSATTLSTSTYNRLGSTTVSGKTYTLTPNTATQVGAAWNKNLISLENSFDFTFNVNICGTADGMMFVIQNTGFNTTLGSTSAGSAMGYYNAPTGTFDQSLGIELDIYNSGTGSPYYDNSASHIALVKNKDGNPLLTPVNITTGLATCSNQKFRVVWNRSINQLKVYYAGNQILSYNNDIVKNIFGGNPEVWFGFTAATGGSSAAHAFSNDTLIYAKPVITTKGAMSICKGDSTLLTGTAGASYLWSNGETSRSIYVKQSGAYRVLVTDATGCSRWSDSVSLKVNLPPVANAGNDASVCPGDSVIIGNAPTGSYSYYWTSIPAGFSSSEAQPKVSPAQNTSYVLTLTNTSTGCSGRDTMKVDVNPSPVVSFTATNSCIGSPVAFVNNCSSPGGRMKYFWRFGDGSVSTDSVPKKSYTKSGNFTVWLIAETQKGCRDSMQRKVTVFSPGLAEFSAVNNCAGKSITFNNMSFYAGGSITGYFWKFGDGTNSTQTAPVKKYAASGTYTVWLVITTDRGCKDSTSHDVTVFPRPEAAFTYTGACGNDSVRFTNASTISSGSRIIYNSWDFGDGSKSFDDDPVHKYSKAGKYTVTLISAAEGGCTDTVSSSITIAPAPIVRIGAASACAGKPMQLTDSSSVAAPATIVGRLWSFGDNNTSTQQNPAHTYAAPGKYTVWLRVVTSEGCADSISRQVTVHALPDTGITITKLQGRKVKFTAAAQGNPQCEWDFGDGNTRKGSDTATYTYGADGNFTVKLKVTNANGCESVTTRQLSVQGVGVADNSFFSAQGLKLYPNPFGDQLTLEYALQAGGQVRISLLEMTGREVAVLSQGMQSAGAHRTTFTTADQNLPAGVYILHMQVGDQMVNRQVVKW